MNKEKNFVSAVIYVNNAENRIEKFLQTIVHVMEENFEHSEVICVNDASDDESFMRIKEVCKSVTSTTVSVVNMSCYHGLESAMNAGLDLAIGDFVFEFDNTFLDFDEKEIMRIYQHSLEGYDIVSAVPNRKEKFSSQIFYRVFERFADKSYQMSTESFRVLSRRVINRIHSMNIMVPYRKVIYANCGLKTDRIQYSVINDLCRDIDKKEKRLRANLAVDALLLFTTFGYKVALAMMIVMMLVSVFMLCYAVVIFLVAHPVAGWTSTILFLSFVFQGLFGILAIIIKYLQILVNLVFKKKFYSFESIEKLTK